MGSGLPINGRLLSKLPPLERLSSLSEMSDNDDEAPDRLVWAGMISNESVLMDDNEIFRLFAPGLEDLIPGDFSEISLFLGWK